MNNILIIGYGNPGRADDGLGHAFAEEIEKLNLINIDFETDYQLSVEHAHDISKKSLTLLFDAHVSCKEPFEITKIKPASFLSLSSHRITPENILKLANDISGSNKDIFLIGIRGYEFNEFKEELSDKAFSNLKKTVDYFRELLISANPDIIITKLNQLL